MQQIDQQFKAFLKEKVKQQKTTSEISYTISMYKIV